MSCEISTLSLESQIIQLQNELIEARCNANRYKELHQRDIAIRERMQYEHEHEIRILKQKHKEKEEAYLLEIAELKAKLALRERQLFGTKSEKDTSKNESEKSPEKQRGRGQQKGKAAPPKRDYSHLPVTVEVQSIDEHDLLCPCCHAPYTDIGSSEDSDTVEIEVKAHIRRVKRKKYKRSCQCHQQPLILTAPQLPKVMAKSHLGNSVWVYFLLQKYWHGMPWTRAIQNMSSYELSISISTVVEGCIRLLPLLLLIYQKILDKSLQDKRWHADETGWKVFEFIEGKVNNRWFLWVFRSESTAVFVLDPSRSAKVVENFFGDKSSGIISCDRYRAYFCFVTLADGRFLIAYCWAHVRRDFLALAKDRSPHEAWAMNWLSEIGHLYHINNLRVSQKKDSTEFDEYQLKIEQAVTIFKEKVDKQLAEKDLAIPCKKVLESLIRHWHGLITFVENAQVPMDNNTAERELRRGVVGRKNYYGSGSIKNAQLSAAMFTIVHTLLIWNINPQIWLQSFFDHMGKHWDQDFDSMLPWNLSSEEKGKFLLKSGCGPPS